MRENERWDYIISLDDELLKGGVILSEWASFITREADTAFAKGAYLGCILTAVAGIETYLRSECAKGKRKRFVELITDSAIDADLKSDLHKLRRYRNQWVHVDEPWEEEDLLEYPEKYEKELEEMTFVAIHCLRRTLYEYPCI